MRQTVSRAQKLLNKRGSALAVALVMTTVSALVLIGLGQLMVQQQVTNQRKYELSRAFYAAEAGVAMVLHWGNFPAQYTPDPNLFVKAASSGGAAAMFPNLAAAIAGDGLTITREDLDGMEIGAFTSDHEYEAGTIEEIQILAPEVGDPVACFFKVHVRGRSPRGVERNVLVYLNVAQTLLIQIPAGLISFNTATAFGNARVHWGEAWSKNNFDMLNRSQMDYLIPSNADYDQWAKYRTEASISFPSSWKWGEGKDLYDATRDQPGLAPASGDFADAFFQNIPQGTLEWPTFDYQTFKDMALAHGRYYSTDASGNVYRDGIETEAHKVDFMTEFGVENRATAPYDLVFVDTIDGNAPAANGANLATIQASGTSIGLKGIMYIGASFDAGGVGSPFTMPAKDPADVTHNLEKIFLDGVLYAAGTIELSGNAGVFGSVIAQRGFAGGGTPDIYYNSVLSEGLEFGNGNVGSVFVVALQKNY